VHRYGLPTRRGGLLVAAVLLLINSCSLAHTPGAAVATAKPVPPVPPLSAAAGFAADGAAAASYDGQQERLNYYRVVGEKIDRFATQPLRGCIMYQLTSLDGDLLVLCRAGDLIRLHPGRTGAIARTFLGTATLGLPSGRDIQVDGIAPDATRHTVFVFGRVQRPEGSYFDGFSVQLAGASLTVQKPAMTMTKIIQSAAASGGRVLTVSDDGKLRSVPSVSATATPLQSLPPGSPSLIINAAGGGQWVIGGTPAGSGLVVTPAGALVRTLRLDTYAAAENSSGDLIAVHRVGNVFSLIRVTRHGRTTPCGEILGGQPLGILPLAADKALLFLHGPHGKATLLDLRSCAVSGQYDTPRGEVDFTALR